MLTESSRSSRLIWTFRPSKCHLFDCPGGHEGLQYRHSIHSRTLSSPEWDIVTTFPVLPIGIHFLPCYPKQPWSFTITKPPTFRNLEPGMARQDLPSRRTATKTKITIGTIFIEPTSLKEVYAQAPCLVTILGV
jgi:hypothetical protein